MQYIFSLCVYLLDDDTDDTETDDDTDQGDDEETSFSEQPGYALHEPCNTPMECFSLFFNNEVWEFLVSNTNEYASHKLTHCNVSTYFLQNNIIIGLYFRLLLNLYTTTGNR